MKITLTLNEYLKLIRFMGFCAGGLEALRLTVNMPESQADGLEYWTEMLAENEEMLRAAFKNAMETKETP